MEPKIINSKNDYIESTQELDRLLTLDPEPGTTLGNKIELFAKLIEEYEKKQFVFDLPSPVYAIKFRMEHQGLQQKDLVPFIGSKSKVSEILSGKRPLTLSMIRALHEGLDIPLQALVSESKATNEPANQNVDWKLFPISIMHKLGWISKSQTKTSEEVMRDFLLPLGGKLPSFALFRAGNNADSYSLIAWVSRIIILSKTKTVSKYTEGTINKEFLKDIIRLSIFENGPVLAQEYLSKNGIALVIEPNLPNTKVDGAAIVFDSKHIIGMSLRYDRLDSFWFTLVHELIHLSRHIKDQSEVIVDDLDDLDGNDVEKEANRLAKEAFIPRSIWLRSNALHLRTPAAINESAEKLRIHPAIVAGRLRFELKNYRIFTDLLGQGEVRKLFNIRD